MNPFDFYGPQFLVFYLLYGLAVLGLLFAFRHGGERDDAPRMNLSDPYLIASLRAGPNEALRVATVSLIDRRMLKVEGELLTTRFENAGEIRDPLERAVVERFDARDTAKSVFGDARCRAAADRLGASLERLGLVPGPGERWARRARLLLAMAALWLVAAKKIEIGWDRNRPVGYLFILAVLLTVGAWRLHDPRQTRRGEALLDDLRALFARLKSRAGRLHPARDSAEAALVAAVFGIAVLPEAGWLHLRNMYRRALDSPYIEFSSDVSCGSPSSSGGDGCGGGGCGGGCGGCGS